MKHVHVFHHEHYHRVLENQIGKGIPVFRGYRQKGGGLGSILGFIGRYGLPLITKYILPHAAPAIMSTVSDITNGQSIKTALKSNAIKMATKFGKSILKPQAGAGLGSRKRKALLGATSEECKVLHESHHSSNPKKSKASSVKSGNKRKTPTAPKKRRSIFSKRDIFG